MEAETIQLLAYRGKRVEVFPLFSSNGAHRQCTVRLRQLPGTRWMRVILQIAEKDDIVYRGDVEGDEGMPFVTLDVQRDADGRIDVFCLEGVAIRRLHNKPDQAPYENPINWPDSAQRFDLAIVIDATTRVFRQRTESTPKLDSSFLLDTQNRELWQAHVDQLANFVETLRDSCTDCRISVLAFGDQTMPENVTASDLKPAFLIHPKRPADRALRNLDAGGVRARLLNIPKSPGADFVDALADALAACHDLAWRASLDVRKLVLISGDSPGYSILHPVPKGDACVREHDVDSQVLRLNRKGVAILSLFQNPPEEYWRDLVLDEKRVLQESARDQYLRLASLPALAFDATTFEGSREAEAILQRFGMFGYDGCLAEWVD